MIIFFFISIINKNVVKTDIIFCIRNFYRRDGKIAFLITIKRNNFVNIFSLVFRDNHISFN